jgi:hypothetical protein
MLMPKFNLPLKNTEGHGNWDVLNSANRNLVLPLTFVL